MFLTHGVLPLYSARTRTWTFLNQHIFWSLESGVKSGVKSGTFYKNLKVLLRRTTTAVVQM